MGRKALFGLLSWLLAAVCVGLLSLGGLVERLEHPLYDWRARLAAARKPSTDRVKLVLLDQASLDWAGREMSWPWPWPREAYGVLLDYLERQGAKTVVLDVLFTEPSMYGVPDDEALGAAAARSGSVVGAVFLGASAVQTTSWPAAAEGARLGIGGLEAWLAGRPGAASALPASGAAFPVPELAGRVAWLGGVGEYPDGDGVFRRVAPFRLFDGRIVPSLGLAAWLAGGGGVGGDASSGDGRTVVVRGSLEPPALLIGDRVVPLDDSGRTILRFRGPSGTYETFSAAAVIQSELRILEGGRPPIEDGGVFRDAHVVFGFSAPGLKDLRPSPMGGDYPGAEIHATMLDNLMEGDFLRDLSPVALWLWIAALSVAAGTGAATSRTAWQSAGVAVALLALPTAAGVLAWNRGVVLPAAGATIGVVIAQFGGAVVNFVLEGRQKRFLKEAFRHYLSPEVIDTILRNPGSLRLGGEQRELTIFFSDLEGFSTISERLGPEALTKLLNDYLSDMTDIILEEGGTLDKYEGDAIIAFWNAPVAQADHAVRAVRAAVRCGRALAARRKEFEERTGAVLRMRIGLNTGAVVVGNMGSSSRFDYTVLGDAANLASRLEGANKAPGTYLMIAESTWIQTGAVFPGRELGRLRVVGRATPVRVFEATGLEGEATDPAGRVFEAGLGYLRTGRWEEAARTFETLPGDAAAKKYAARCRQVAVSGPDAPWDGIWNLTEK